MNTIIAKLVKTHTDSNNGIDYSPIFVSQSNINDGITGSVGYFTNTFFGIHNPSSSAITVNIKTAEQGITGDGVDVRINSGETFYTVISKITVESGVTVVLLGTPTGINR
jgi:hypothetical protein